MGFLKRFIAVCLTVCAGLALTGLGAECGAREQAPEEEAALSEIVARTLSKAAEDSHEHLALLSRLRGQRQAPNLPPPDEALSARVTMV
jgi:hypothetical protein